MKVAFYNHTSTVSGAEISLLLTAKNLQQWEPVIYAPEGELLQRAREAGIDVQQITSYRARLSNNPLKLLWNATGMIQAGLRFARTIRRTDVDLVHANSLRAGIIASLFKWIHRKPLVWHIRDNPPGGIVGNVIQFVSGRTADATISISSAVLSQMNKQRLGSRLHLVHNGVELKLAGESGRNKHRQRIRQQLNTPEASNVLVIAGQIAPWKRQEDAIRATAQLVQEAHDLILWVVGEAKFREENIAYKSKLRQLAEELGISQRVRFTGFRNDILEICLAADILLLCSDNEPFGRVLIEAMSQSLPVIATNAGGVPEIIVDEESGILYEIGDIEALAGHISGLLSLPEERHALGRRGEERVKRLFTIQHTVNKIEAIYQQVIEASAADDRVSFFPLQGNDAK